VVASHTHTNAYIMHALAIITALLSTGLIYATTY